jgi:hypothetical protein
MAISKAVRLPEGWDRDMLGVALSVIRRTGACSGIERDLRRGQGGPVRELTVLAVFVGALMCTINQKPLNGAEIFRTLYFRSNRQTRRLLGIRTPREFAQTRTGRIAIHKRVCYLWARIVDLHDSSPLSGGYRRRKIDALTAVRAWVPAWLKARTNRRWTRRDIELAFQSVTRVEQHDLDQRERRLHRLATDLLAGTHPYRRPFARGLPTPSWRGDVVVDATIVESHAQNTYAHTNGPRTDPGGGWYTTDGDKPPDRRTWVFGHLQNTMNTVGRVYGERIPALTIALVPNPKPGSSPGKCGAQLADEARAAGYPTGYFIADKGYTSGAQYHYEVASAGYTTVFDPKPNQIGVRGADASGAVVANGALFCPAAVELTKATVSNLQGRRRETTSRGAKRREDLLREQLAYRMHPINKTPEPVMRTIETTRKDGTIERTTRPDLRLRFRCPARQGTCDCPLAARLGTTPNRRGRNDLLPVVTHPPTEAEAPSCCRNETTSVYLSDWSGYLQHHPPFTLKHDDIYFNARAYVEGTYGSLKHPAVGALTGKSIEGSGRARMTIATIFTVMANNLRLYAAWLDDVAENDNNPPVGPRAVQRATRKKLGIDAISADWANCQLWQSPP